MKKIIFKKLTIKEKKKVLAGRNDPGNVNELKCSGDPPEMDDVNCKPSLPDSPCVQGRFG